VAPCGFRPRSRRRDRGGFSPHFPIKPFRAPQKGITRDFLFVNGVSGFGTFETPGAPSSPNKPPATGRARTREDLKDIASRYHITRSKLLDHPASGKGQIEEVNLHQILRLLRLKAPDHLMASVSLKCFKRPFVDLYCLPWLKHKGSTITMSHQRG